ncbi:MAG: hypothetical protein AAF368_03550 [Planctomycetota bacterium]
MSEEPEEEPELAPYKIENARSGRSKCKVCRKKIDQGTPRFGIRIDGPFGQGYIWQHLRCAASADFETVKKAYADGLAEPDVELPPLEELEKHVEQAEKRKKKKKEIPYAELDPSGRAKCKFSGETIPKGSFRVAVGKAVEFYGQTRTQAILILPQFVAEALQTEDSASEVDGFEEALRANSESLSETQIEEVLGLIGPLC